MFHRFKLFIIGKSEGLRSRRNARETPKISGGITLHPQSLAILKLDVELFVVYI